jgi:hypothetical protein
MVHIKAILQVRECDFKGQERKVWSLAKKCRVLAEAFVIVYCQTVSSCTFEILNGPWRARHTSALCTRRVNLGARKDLLKNIVLS